jgi:hypothetical protein
MALFHFIVVFYMPIAIRAPISKFLRIRFKPGKKLNTLSFVVFPVQS